MEKETLLQKINRRGWYEIRKRLKGTFYLLTYVSYWHYLFHKPKEDKMNTSFYFAARPNPGAGIGHQLANWIAGFWFAEQFNLKFAHLPFSNPKWENFLGFGDGEAKVEELAKSGYRIRELPLFDEFNQFELNRIKAILNSYSDRKIVFIAGQDQGYKNQFGVINSIREKFNQTPARKKDQVIYKSDRFNIAVHVRRTVVIDSKVILEDDTAKALRWLSNDYYEKVLKQVVQNIQTSKPICIYLFSTGKPEEFVEFSKYGDVHFCSEMNEYATFLHLVRADLLISSKSSFSYKPALLSDGIKVCPRNFWHSYPESKDWILVENDGTFNVNCLKNLP